MTMRRAECSCGQLSATCTGEPVRVSVCHCLACKRRTGSAFSYNLRFAAADVVVAGRSTEFTRVGDEGGHAVFSFCPDCGDTVCYRFVEAPEVIAIPGGAFADMDLPAPAVSVYDPFRRYAWVDIQADPLERM